MATVQPPAHGRVYAPTAAAVDRGIAEEDGGAGHADHAGVRSERARRAGGHQGRQTAPLGPPQDCVGLYPEAAGRTTLATAGLPQTAFWQSSGAVDASSFPALPTLSLTNVWAGEAETSGFVRRSLIGRSGLVAWLCCGGKPPSGAER